MKSAVLRAKQAKDLVKQLKEAGYEVTNDGIGYIAKLDGEEVFRALPDAAKRTYLVRYAEGLVS